MMGDKVVQMAVNVKMRIGWLLFAVCTCACNYFGPPERSAAVCGERRREGDCGVRGCSWSCQQVRGNERKEGPSQLWASFGLILASSRNSHVLK